MADTTKTQSPYVRARQEWDERFGDQIKSRNNWRLAAFVSMGTTFLCVTGMVAIGYRSSTVPYVVALDDVGRAVPVLARVSIEVADFKGAPRDSRDGVGIFHQSPEDSGPTFSSLIQKHADSFVDVWKRLSCQLSVLELVLGLNCTGQRPL